MKPMVRLLKLGHLSYPKALKVQQQLFDNLKSNLTWHSNTDITKSTPDKNNTHGLPQTQPTGNTLILVQHDPVYTIGIRSKLYDSEYVVKLRRELEEHNLEAEFFQTSRGGLITFHGPGQLVAYPILYLGDFAQVIKNRSLKAYVNLLESTMIDTLAKVGIEGAHTVAEHPGIWLESGERKIGFIGIACKRYVTMHGISINCNCDLRWFDFIVSCGIDNKQVTSIQKEMFTTGLSCHPINHPSDTSTSRANTKSQSVFSNVETVVDVFCKSFSEHFNCILVDKY